MTDHKSWLWRKKSSEKPIVVADKVDITPRQNEEELHVLLAEKAELERDLRDLSNKLSSVITECNTKDELVKKHSKTAQEALAGWEKAEAKALSLKEELDEVLKQRESSENRIHQLDAALKECMQQLRFVREDQEHRIHDVLVKASEELEETKMALGEKLAESSKKIANLIAENSQLNEMLFLKDQLIEDLHLQRGKLEGNLNALLVRLESTEKDNNTLRYEVRLLEKEVDIRNEEREFNRRAADAAHKQHLENVKKIAKLESECQRLRVLVRKRLPGPAAVAKMRSEVDMLQRDSMGNRRKKSNTNPGNLQLSYADGSYPESPGKKINFLTDRLCMLEEENNSLREILQKKMNELQISRNMYVQTASKLSQVETQLDESPKCQITNGLRSSTMSDVGSDDKVSCAGSWASALISELEHFRDGKDKVTISPSKSVARSEMSHLMDDFAEMEKLALVCVDKPTEDNTITSHENDLNLPSETTGKELVLLPAGGDENSTVTSGNGILPSQLSMSISKLIEMIEGMNLPSQDGDAHNNPETDTGYSVRVFQWKTSDLAVILQNFLHICDDLLHERVDFERFTLELTSVVEWIMNHCFSLQDVSSMKDDIRKQLGWDETKSESEVEAGMPMLKEQLSSATNGYHNEMHRETNEEGRKLKDTEELELHNAVLECESLKNQLQEAETAITSLRTELEALKDSKAMIEDQFENQNMTVEDLNSQLSAVKCELDEAHQTIVSLEAEVKNKLDHCEGLESKCLDLQLQLERATEMDKTEHPNQDEKQLPTEWEISGASEKLAECQETIFNLQKQLTALAASRNVVVSDKFIPTPAHAPTVTPTTPTQTTDKKLTNQRSSLLDQMLAEDDAEAEQLESPITKEIICSKEPNIESNVMKSYEPSVGPLAIVPSKKQQTTAGGLFKKLLWRRKKSSSKKMLVPFAV